MRDFVYSFDNVYEGNERYNSIGSASGAMSLLPDNAMFKCYMEIPLNKEQFELPAFLLYKFKTIMVQYCADGKPFPDKLEVPLYTFNSWITYKTLPCIIGYIWRLDFMKDRLVPIRVDKCKEAYYGTPGGIFDSNYEPLALQTWTVTRESMPTGENSSRDIFILERPNLWVNPEVYNQREDEVQRFIVNKMIKAASGHVCSTWGKSNACVLYRDGHTSFYIRTILDNCPVTLKLVDTPSISTTNEDLIDLALKYKEEIIQ